MERLAVALPLLPQRCAQGSHSRRLRRAGGTARQIPELLARD